MHMSYRFLVFGLTIALIAVQIAQPNMVWAQDKITQFEPQIMGTPEEQIEPPEVKSTKSKKMIWIGAIAGVVLLGGLAGLALGGSDPGSDTGNIDVSW